MTHDVISTIRNFSSCGSTCLLNGIESKEILDHICKEATQRLALTNHLMAAK